MPIPRHRVRSISWVTGDDQVSCDPRVASGCVVLDEKVSRLTLDPAFRLDAPPATFPVDPGLDLSALSPTATAAGRIAIRSAIPIADAMALLATLFITANTNWIGLSFALLALCGLAATGKHDARVDLRVLKDAPSIAAWVAIALTGTLLLAPSTAAVDARLRLALVGFGALLLGRLLAYAAIRAMRSHHLVRQRTLIIGAGPLSTQLATTLADHPEFGLQPIGFLDARRIASGASMAVLGDYTGLERVVREFEVRRVIIGFGDNLDLAQMVRSCQALRVRTHLIARGGHGSPFQPWSGLFPAASNRARRPALRPSQVPQHARQLRFRHHLVGRERPSDHPGRTALAQDPHYEDRHRAPVGITGWAQVNKLRGDSSITERVRMDNYYIEHWSPWLDLVIVLRTVGEIIRCL